MFARLKQRLTICPLVRYWLEAALWLALIGACAFGVQAIGEPETLRSETQFSIPLPVFLTVTFVLPSCLEEIVFRGLLQPQNLSSIRDYVLSALSLALFVVWHPVQVWLHLPMGQPLFLKPEFLLMSFILGLACTALTRRSTSLWPAILLHWLSVIGWKLFFSEVFTRTLSHNFTCDRPLDYT